MTGIRRALMFASVDRYTGLLVNFVTVVIISRLLTPVDIGVMAIGASTIAFAESLRDFVSGYLVQKPEVTQEDVQTTFTAMLLLSLLMFVCVLLLAGPIAGLAKDERLRPFLQVVAVALLPGPFERPVMALLRRDLQFSTIAVVSIAGVVSTAITTLALAASGFGPMSFAWAALVGNVAVVIVVFWLAPHRVTLRLRLNGWRNVVAFGGYSSAAGALVALYELLPNLLLARIMSLNAVGLYSRALLVCQLPSKTTLTIVAPIVLPAFAVAAREGRDLVRPFLHMIELFTAVQWPALIVVAILAHPIVAVLLGPQWMAIVPLVQIIAIGSLLLCFTMLSYQVVTAVGGVRDVVWALCVALPASALVVSVGAFFGLVAAASSLIVANQLQVYAALRAVRLHVPFSWRELARACSKSAVVTAIAACGPLSLIALRGWQFDLSIPLGIVAGLTSIVCWIAAIWLTGHALGSEIVNALSALRGAAIGARAVEYRNRVVTRLLGMRVRPS